jgi:5-methylcytosine-specific restriction endonuclease McrA
VGTTKVCKSCEVETPVSGFYRDAKSADRLRYECKACGKAATVARLRANPAAGKAATERWKIAHPGRAKELRVRDLARRREQDRVKARRWYAKNREAEKARSTAYTKEHYAEILAKRRARYATDAGYRLRQNAYAAGRRMFGRGGSLTPAEWTEIWASYRGLCAYCPASARSMDHVVPRADGGRHEAGNVVPACRSCNSSKRSRPLLRFLLARGILSKAA